MFYFEIGTESCHCWHHYRHIFSATAEETKGQILEGMKKKKKYGAGGKVKL